MAQSHNYYPVFQMKPEDGVATIAIGLGKQVVEGGDAVRFCPRYPQVLPQFRSPAEVMKVAQREFFALDLECGEADLLSGADATLARLQLSQAEADGTLSLAGSVVDTEEDRIYDGVGRRGSRVVTFARILKYNAFPLCAILNELFEVCRTHVGFAVEIEFAVDVDTDPAREPVFYFLQMRPLVASRERCDITRELIAPEKVICRSQRVLGNGRIEGVRDLVYVHPAKFDRGRSAEVASVVAEINRTAEARTQALCADGAGTLGLVRSVDWNPRHLAPDLRRARAIVEVPATDLPMGARPRAPISSTT